MAKSKMSVYVKPREQAPAAEEKKSGIKSETKKAEAKNETQQVLLSNILASRPPKHPRPREDVDDESTRIKTGEVAELQTAAAGEDETQLSDEAGPLPDVPVPAPDAPPQMPEMKAEGEAFSPSSSPVIQSSALEPLRMLEAALFMSSQSLQAAELGKLVGIAAVGHVNQLLADLGKQYDASGSALEVVEENPGKWAMRIRASFAPAVRRFAGEAEIPRHALRTLAYVSRHEGITKRELFKRLGSTIYEDAAELIDKGFVAAKPAGRTMSLSTTPKFKQYFQE